MSIETYDLFTLDGENLADRLVRAICSDIGEDRLTRRQAMDRAADALERIAAIDEGVAAPEPLVRIAAKLSLAFDAAGFLPVSGELLRGHFDAWRKSGAEVSHTQTLPETVMLVTSAARLFAEAAAPLFGRDDFKALVADSRPWEDGFTREPVASAELVLCVMTGGISGNPNVLCVVAGPTGYVYIEQLTEVDIDRPAVLRTLLRRDDLDYVALANQLHSLADAADSINLASQIIDAPGRLSISLEVGQAGPTVVALWDGEPIASARQDDVAAVALADSAASESCLPGLLPGLLLVSDHEAGFNAEDVLEVSIPALSFHPA